MRRAALYARVSTDRQEREQTLQSQLAAITRYADQQGFRHSPALTYADNGYSGTWLDRPGLDELRDHAQEGRFDVVVVLCPDRLARRYAYQVLLLEELKRTGIEVCFCERPISDSPDDQLLLQIQGAIAEYERGKILERCRRGRLHRARRGELAPPVTPYGYSYSARKYGGDGKIRIDEDEAALVRQVFAWYLAKGGSVYRVRQKLDASSWTPRRGGRNWQAGTVQRILHCEWYIGRAYYNRMTCRQEPRSREEIAAGRPAKAVKIERPRAEWIVVPVPRIIDDEVFARSQERVATNQRLAKRRLRRVRSYLLRGLIKCGLCGHAYRGFTQTFPGSRPGYAYYVCNARYGPERCSAKMLRGAGVDEVVWTTVRNLLLDSEAVASELAGWLERTTSDATADERAARATSRLKEMNRQRERLIDAYQTGALALEDFHTRKTSAEERILTVEHELAELRCRAARRELATRQVVGATEILERLRCQLEDPSFEVKQAILRFVVDKVVVTGKRLEIHLALEVSGSFSLCHDRGASPRCPTTPPVGGKAQQNESWLARQRPHLRVFRCPHPSPVFVNRSPENKNKLQAAFQVVAAFLASAASS